ncbi:hypothetical protein SPOG_01173 [Schizosaccharomyces cryophilus OY26]|uniref:Uncharacterized protein n=1 Tax=Schizosaccharomyces cryophilus (strain OY26 / ATCC MYA-4695 / CBS 11777 / NBRC 106824 / NRRL Y48691) TaxID=653667 RepID=S9X9J8_SCHCR|nr:uncharacterized protein SPOG_01173 [Schizosaccharomyces cryophilus OY26]EPY50416.1 hypothetical protein SPOG_01173 [Schizosaccharomyces cryophilus OY26]
MFPENSHEDGASSNHRKSAFWKRLSQDSAYEKPRRSRHVQSYSISDFPSELQPTRAAPEPPKGKFTQYARRFSSHIKSLFSKKASSPSGTSNPSYNTFFHNHHHHHRLPVQTDIVPSPREMDWNYEVKVPNKTTLSPRRTYVRGHSNGKKSSYLGRSRSLNLRPESTSISFPLHLYKSDTAGSNPRTAFPARTSSSSTYSSLPRVSGDNESLKLAPIESLNATANRKTEGYVSILNRRSVPNPPSSLNFGEWDTTPLTNIQEKSTD